MSVACKVAGWRSTLNIANMLTVPEFIYTLTSILIKTLAKFPTKWENLIPTVKKSKLPKRVETLFNLEEMKEVKAHFLPGIQD